MQKDTVSKVCILAAGTGSRLGNLTQDINKCLLPLGGSTALSLIIEQFPQSLPIVIAVGYKADLVREYCSAIHPDRQIEFVDVNPYEGVGAGPGYSLKCCQPFLQTSFFLTTADCLVVEPIPLLQESWIGVCPNDYSGLYSTARVNDEGNVTAFKNKSKQDYEQAFIGLAYIHDADIFWAELESQKGIDNEYEFVSAWYRPEVYGNLKAVNFTWMDTGCVNGYELTKLYYGSKSLGMSKRINELTIAKSGILFKLCPDADKNARRIKRAEILSPFSPNISHAGVYSCAYKWIEGETLYARDDYGLFCEFLDWCQQNLWSNLFSVEDFSDDCFVFYKDKTYHRFLEYLTLHKDAARLVNEVSCPKVSTSLKKLPWDKLSLGNPVLYHGDLQFQNVIHSDEGLFNLIDWREQFASRDDCGDVYYDLAKLYGGILLPYNGIEAISDGFLEDEKGCTYSIHRSEALRRFQPYFETWVNTNGYDLVKIKTLTALVWLNMAPLHVEPVDQLLFAHAQFMFASLA